MLRVTVDLVPFGDEDRALKIAEAVIYNDGTGDSVSGNYVAGFCERGWIGMTKVKNFKRRRHVWALVRSALRGLKV